MEEIIEVLCCSLPEDDKLKIIDSFQEDKTVIFKWRDRGYTASKYSCESETPSTRFVVGKLNSEPDDLSHDFIEMLMNDYYHRSSAGCSPAGS